MASMLGLVVRFHFIITVVLIVIITALSLWPVANLPAVPGSDKTHHFIAYGALMFPSAFCFLSTKQFKKLIAFALFFVAYSGAIELIQPYVNRYGEWLDLAANSAGLVCGIVLAKIMLLAVKPKV